MQSFTIDSVNEITHKIVRMLKANSREILPEITKNIDQFKDFQTWAKGRFYCIDETEKLNQRVNYEDFMKDPSKFFEKHGIQFSSPQELEDICNIIKQMLQYDKADRIKVSDILNTSYVKNYHGDVTQE